jgi:sporulation protein YlmC with PRC-barrel domain
MSFVLVLVLALGACTMPTQPDGGVAPGTQPDTAPETTQQQPGTQPGAAPDTTVQQPTLPSGQFPGVMDAPSALHTVSSLLDYNFESADGEISGTIDDFVIDMQSGRILYAILEHGGFLDLGDSEFAVPMHAFSWGADDQLIVNVDQQSLENYPELGANWPNVDDGSWNEGLNEFWSNMGFDSGSDADMSSTGIVRASDLMDLDTGDMGFGAGSVEDVLIDLQQGIAKFVLLDFGGGLGDDELVAVPFGAFDPQSLQNNELAFGPDFDSTWLESAPRFDRNVLAEGGIFEPTFDDDVEAYWQEQGLLGAAAAGAGAVDGQTPATTTAGIPTGGGSGVADAESALISASALLDYDFTNVDGAVSGEIEDFLVDVNTGRILFATLEYGGFLEIGDTELPVPLSVFTMGADNTLMLNIPEETLDALPDLDTEWVNPTDAAWDDEVTTYWRDEGFDPGFDVTAESGPVMWGSELINTYGVGDVGFGASNVRDLLIDLAQGHIRYAVLDFGGVGTYGAAFGGEMAIVPFEALSMTEIGTPFGFDEGFDMSIVESAPRIVDPSILGSPTPIDSATAEEINNFWEEQGFTPSF